MAKFTFYVRLILRDEVGDGDHDDLTVDIGDCSFNFVLSVKSLWTPSVCTASSRK